MRENVRVTDEAIVALTFDDNLQSMSEQFQLIKVEYSEDVNVADTNHLELVKFPIVFVFSFVNSDCWLSDRVQFRFPADNGE